MAFLSFINGGSDVSHLYSFRKNYRKLDWTAAGVYLCSTFDCLVDYLRTDIPILRYLAACSKYRDHNYQLPDGIRDPERPKPRRSSPAGEVGRTATLRHWRARQGTRDQTIVGIRGGGDTQGDGG